MSYNLSDVKINPANTYEEDEEDKQIPVKSPVVDPNDLAQRRDVAQRRNAYIQSLPPGVREDMMRGGKTQSPLGELGILAATAATVKAAPFIARKVLKPKNIVSLLGIPTNSQELQQDLVQIKGGEPVRKIQKILRQRALERAYKIGKKIPVVSDVIDEATGIIPRIRGITQLAQTGKVTDVGPGTVTNGIKINKTRTVKILDNQPSDKNVFPDVNPFPEDKTLSRLYGEVARGWKPRPGEKIYRGDNFLGDARKLRQKGLSPTEVAEELGVKVRTVNGIQDVQRLRGSASAKDSLGMKAESQLESASTDIRRRITEVQQTPPDQPGFHTDSKAVRAVQNRYGVKLNKHHGDGLKQIDFLYEDASPEDMKELTRYIFEDLNQPIGSIAANRMLIPDTEVHRPLHNWMRKDTIGLEPTGDKTNIMPDLKRVFGTKNLKDLSLEQRKLAAQVYFEHISPASKEKLFELQQEFIKGKLKIN